MAKLNIVLYEPEIPANTGNIGRTCVATGTRLHLIEPLGFRLNEKQIKRAGMDYWKDLDVTTYVNYQEFLEKNEKLRKEGTGAQSYAATMVPVVVSISYINYAIVAVLGGILAMRVMADVGSLASYLVFVRQAALPINQFTQQSNFLLSALAGAERVFDVMNLEPEVDEGDSFCNRLFKSFEHRKL